MSPEANDKPDTVETPGKPPKHYSIHIDRKPYSVDRSPLTGAEIREVAKPPLGSEVDLYLEEPGDKDDLLIGDSDKVDLKNGMHFFSTPRHITPGRD